MKFNPTFTTVLLLIVATTLESFGDAMVRKVIYQYTGTYRAIFGLISAALLFGYGFTLNLTPIEFGKVVGLYIATLFIVWQVVSYITFGSTPSLSVILGGLMIVAGGLVVTFARF